MLMTLSKHNFDNILEECPSERHILVRRIVQQFGDLVPGLDLERIVESKDATHAEVAAKHILEVMHPRSPRASPEPSRQSPRSPGLPRGASCVNGEKSQNDRIAT